MQNQAAGLDKLLADSRDSRGFADSRESKKSTKYIAITSGKGGVGKSTISANLAWILWKKGYKVGVFDADIGLANLDVIFGVRAKLSLLDVLKGSANLDEIVVPIESGLLLIPGYTGEEIFKYDSRLLENLKSDALDNLDFVIIDTGAGIAKNVQIFVEISDYLIVITQPDPSALTDAYAAIKVASKHKNRIFVVINAAKSTSEADAVFKRIEFVARNNLAHLELQMLGKISASDIVTRANRARALFTRTFPQSPPSASIEIIAQNLLNSMEQNMLLNSRESRFNRFLRNLMYRF